MKRLTKLIIPLIVAQAACLLLGLWLQDRFLVSISSWQAKAEMMEAQGVDSEFSPQVQPEEVSGDLLAEKMQETMLPASGLAFVWILGLQGVAAYLLISRANTEHVLHNRARHEESLHKSRELVQTRDAVVFGLAKLAESRDPETGMHLERIAMYATRFASALRQDPGYRDRISSTFVKLIGISSVLHDIGKVGIQDDILLKNGPLSPEERLVMQTHVRVGGECIKEIERRLSNSNFLEMAREIAYYHHERWDGEGYCEGLKGEEIPLAARIVAIADVYDALRSKRCYKDAMSHEKCMSIITSEAGRQFDPGLVRIFERIAPQFKEISTRFQDNVEVEHKKTTLESTCEKISAVVTSVANTETSSTLTSVS